MTVSTQRRSGGYVERGGGGSSSLADVVELILDRGLVIDVFVRVSLVGIEILTVDARIVVASIDTFLRFAEATNRLDLYRTGNRLAHEAVVDTVAATAAVLPMRFPAVVDEEGVVKELLAPHHDHFEAVLGELEGRVQFTLKGRYEQDVVLREVLEGHEEIHDLRDKVHELPEEASYYDRVRLGELVVAALVERRDDDAAQVLERLRPFAVSTVANPPGRPEDLVNAAFLVERERVRKFEDAVEDLGRDLIDRVRLRLLGPLAPYDFVPEE
jgi:hypothetical protein